MKLRDIVRESRETYKGDMSGIPVVGLEHLIPEEICFSEYEICSDKTFTKAFHKGQVLFGRRRAYQKKAAIAHVDGVCSGDIMVLEAIPGKVEPSLLPFIIQNDRFFDYAIQHSEGGLSPRVKWNAIANYEFDLPSIEEQKVLADKLWAAYRVKEAYRQLLFTTDDMLKAKFQEMLKGACKVSLGDVCFRITDGSHTPPQGINHSEYLMISAKNIDGVRLDLNDVRYLSQADFEKEHKRTKIKKDDVLLTIVGTIGRAYLMKGNEPNITLQRSVAVLTPNERIVPSFLYYSMSTDTEFEKEGQGNAQKGVYLAKLAKYQITLPDINMQKEFASIFTQAETTKASLRASIEAIDRVIRSLINQ
ncbi:MAG: restriction endonuclease subunit S [Paludibacteraceae bacterium]|nr:restriction endonuclease subunit S [Paludibacteraceae bacterium]